MKCNESNIQWQCIAWRKIGQDGIIAAMSTAAPPKQKHPQLQRLGDAIRARRKALGYSQEAFADVVGLDRGYMGGIERGGHNVTLLNLLKIVSKLDMSHAEFFSIYDQEVADREDEAPARAQPRAAKSSSRTKH